MITKEQQLSRAAAFNKKLSDSDFYGWTETRWEHGNIVHLRKVENFKIEGLEEVEKPPGEESEPKV